VAAVLLDVLDAIREYVSGERDNQLAEGTVALLPISG
jgi:hypothetical protein